MREKEYWRKRMRMDELRPKLDDTGQRPGPRFDGLVFAEWSDTDPEA